MLRKAFYRFIPPHLSGCQLWLAADRITGLADGGAVGTWSDLSGNGRDATQATAAKKPTYKTAIINGKPVVRFDGIDDYLKTAAFTLNQPVTIGMVLNPNALTALNYYVLDGNTDDTQDIYASDATHLRLYAGVAGPEVDKPTAACVLMAMFNGAASSLAINGAAPTVANAGASNAGGITIGTSGSTFQSPGAFDMAEMAVYNRALDAGERGRLTRYLGRKYGIAVS